jgi:carboxypeptidase C (cathepsin A)
MLVVHGYYDTVTPFYQTELDLAAGKLLERVPIKYFAGGHMTYVSDEARLDLRKAFTEFYDAPPYSPPPLPSVLVDGLNAMAAN